MTPHLARRGKLALLTGLLFIVVGALYGSSPLISLGMLAVCGIMTAYVWYFPNAIMLRRRKVELSWWIPPGSQPGGALTVDRPFAIHIALRNHGQRRLRVLSIDVLGSDSLELPQTLEALVPGGQQVEVEKTGRARSSGYKVLHGAVLHFGDVLGLFAVHAYFPNPIAIKVFPRNTAVRGGSRARPRGGSLHERVGLHQVRRRGLAGELRELRDHTSGDPFKFIAWKATARKRKLMVRDLESEIVVTHQILLDIGASMRSGPPGTTKLDYGIETAAALGKSALDSGDRVGLVTFDTRVFSQLKAKEGHHHHLQMVDRLLETQNIVDEDLTDITSSELVANVANYLAHQEAIDVRMRKAPPLDDPIWERIAAGPSGDLYDMKVVGSVVTSLLKVIGQGSQKRALAPAWWWSRVNIGPESEPQMAKLRLFCRLRGLDLPYAHVSDLGRRSAGLSEALFKATSGERSDVLVVISDLSRVFEDEGRLSKALLSARRGGRRVIVLYPFEPYFAPGGVTAVGQEIRGVLDRDAELRFARERKLLSKRGIPVLKIGPADSPASLIARISRAGAGIRRAA